MFARGSLKQSRECGMSPSREWTIAGSPADGMRATAPPGRRMGHAGAIVSGGKGTAAAKIAAFKAAGIGVAATPSEMAETLLKMM